MVVGLLLAYTACTLAEPDPLDAFLARFRAMKTLRARVKQEVRSSVGVDVAEGTVWMKRPRRLRWEYDPPENNVFVLDGNRSVFYEPGENQMIVRTLDSDEIGESPLGFLLDEGSGLGGYLRNRLPDGSDGSSKYRLIPRSPGSSIAQICVEFEANSLFIKEITLLDDSGSSHVYRFSDILENRPIPDGLFRLTPPKGTDIIRQ